MSTHNVPTDGDHPAPPACPLPGHDPRWRDRQVNWPVGFDSSQLPAGIHSTHLRHLLIGLPEDVNREILDLYHCGYALDSWSLPQPIPGSAEVITGYIKQSYRFSGWSDR